MEEEESDVLDMEDFEPNDLPRAQERRKLMLCTEYAKVMCGLWRVRPVAFVVMRASVFGVFMYVCMSVCVCVSVYSCLPV